MTNAESDGVRLRVLVTGGRDFNDRESLFATMDRLLATCPFEALIHGGASGADLISDEWAFNKGIERRRYDAEWDKYGKAAGCIRNQQMLTDEKPDLVVAFPGGRGTADMVRRAKTAGVAVMEVEPSKWRQAAKEIN